jgi:hypothetical protein
LFWSHVSHLLILFISHLLILFISQATVPYPHLRIRILFLTLKQIRIPDPNFHSDTDLNPKTHFIPDLDPSNAPKCPSKALRIRILLLTMMRIWILPYTLKRIRILPFTLIGIRIQHSKMMRIRGDPDPQYCLKHCFIFRLGVNLLSGEQDPWLEGRRWKSTKSTLT